MRKKRFHLTVVYETGLATTITNRYAADEKEAILKEVTDPMKKNDKIISITCVEVKEETF